MTTTNAPRPDSAQADARELCMPSLGADMEYGTLVRWHVAPGAAVKRGDTVAEVETQKGVFSVDARHDSVVEALLVTEGTRVPVGAPIVRLRAAADMAPEHDAATTATAATTAPPSAATPTGAPPVAVPPAPVAAVAGPPDGGEQTTRDRRVRASPLARRVAAELGVTLDSVSGTGEGGAILREDVERAAAEGSSEYVGTPPSPASVTAAPASPAVARSAVSPATSVGVGTSGMRQAIAAAMARSKREIPHYYLSQEIDLRRMMEWLRDTNASRDVTARLLPVALLLKGVARALGPFGEFNGHWIDGAFRPSEAVHLGVAVALRGGGLVAPALQHADIRSTDDLMRALLDLVKRARRGGLKTSEMTDPTVTVTSLGDTGAQSVFGVIYPPQVAIVGFGAIAERPWAADGMLGVRPTITATLAADHRVSDGHRGALFLGEIARQLQAPEAL